MGNSLGGKKTTKIMKINGETIKLKTPVKAGEVVKDYPGYVLLESEAVKHYGTRAKPLGLDQNLERKRLYFLVELPKFTEEKSTRRVRSGIQMSAKDRLESLKLARRSISDLSSMKPSSSMMVESNSSRDSESGSETTRVRLRLPKAEVIRLMEESKDEAEAAQKIMDLCMGEAEASKGKEERQVHWKGGNRRIGEGYKAREKRVSFLKPNEGEIQVAVA